MRQRLAPVPASSSSTPTHSYEEGQSNADVLVRPRFSVPSVGPSDADSESENDRSHGPSTRDPFISLEPLDEIVGPTCAPARAGSWAGPRTAAFLCGCAGVAALAAMGFTGVGAPLLGIPLGGWLIAGAVGATHVAQLPNSRANYTARRLLTNAGRSCRRLAAVPWTPTFPLAEAKNDALTATPRLRLADAINSTDKLRDAAAAMRGISARAAVSLRTLNDQIDPAVNSARAAIMPNRRSTGPLRVTALLDAGSGNLLLAAAAGRAMCEQLAQWESADPADDYGVVLDGPGSPRVGVVVYKTDPCTLVIEPVRRLRGEIQPAESHDGWDDWSRPLPMGYAGVFPLQLDTGRVTLTSPPGAALIADGTSATLIVALAEAAGELTRNIGRKGASPTTAARARATAGTTANAALRALAAALSDRMGELTDPSTDSGCRAAARVLSAWAVSSHNEMSELELLAIARLTSTVLGDETVTLLRLAAAEYAAGDEHCGTQTLVRAYHQLRQQRSVCEVDPLAYILAELELGTPGPLTVGRVAAGVTLLWATSPDENLSYLHDDLLEDLSDAGRFGERSREIDAMRSVIAALDAARAADQSATRLSQAA